MAVLLDPDLPIMKVRSGDLLFMKQGASHWIIQGVKYPYRTIKSDEIHFVITCDVYDECGEYKAASQLFTLSPDGKICQFVFNVDETESHLERIDTNITSESDR